jgi:hypothetical protein
MSDQPGLFDVSYKEPRRVRGTKSGPREWYLNFGGWFAHPQEDIDVFVRLPRWRQREIRATRAAFHTDPTLISSTIQDVRTGKPIPGQNVYAPPEGLYLSYQGPPNSVKYDIPDGISLDIARKFGSHKLRDEAEKLTSAERKELGYLF